MVTEGWQGQGQWRAYSLSAWHGQRQVRISMPAFEFERMTPFEQRQWIASARRRVESGNTRSDAF